MSKPVSSPAERFERDAAIAGESAADALGALDIAAIVILGLLLCPPLAILVVVVAVPLLAIALVVGLLAAVLALPYLLVRHFRGGAHLSVFKQRLRHAGRALGDLAPHRIFGSMDSGARQE
jgi:hypothetical protein